MSFSFNPERKQQFKTLLKRYPDKRSATLPALHLAQEQEGHLSGDTIAAVAEMLDISAAEIMDTASFYTMFYRVPQGKYKLQVCQTLSCSLAGADELVDYISSVRKIRVGETSADGKFTLLKVECLGSCGTGPVIQINDDYYENMTINKLERIMGKLV
ncbi:NADH-quinone oxidoreductase subunit NuoE [Candidatus Neomarinimicrobiota bacterium]